MLPRIAILGALTALVMTATPVRAGLHAGDHAPDFRGTDLDGVSHKLSDYRGKVVMLFVLGNF
jgi:hypothetical protein